MALRRNAAGTMAHRPSGPVPDKPSPPNGWVPTTRSNLVAIHVYVACPDAPDDLLDPGIDPGVNAKSQTIALRVYRVDHRVNSGSGKTSDM